NTMPRNELVIRPENEKLEPFDRKVIRWLELPVLRSVVDAEQRGMPLNVPAISRLRKQIRKDNLRLLTDIYRSAKKQFKISSNPQLVNVLQGLGIEITTKTKKGK